MTAGRQREFDKRVALEAAMHCFWRNGYSGTSLADLTGAMGINKPSLYAAFGNKESLFRQSLAHYSETCGGPHATELEAYDKALKDRVRSFLESVALMLCDEHLPGGCLIAEATNEAGSDCLPDASADFIKQLNQATRTQLSALLKPDENAGQLPMGHTAESIALYLLTVQFGLSGLARTGGKLNELLGVIDTAALVF